MPTLLRLIGLALGLGFLLLLGLLAFTHWEIRQVQPGIPDPQRLLEATSGGPIALSVVHTANLPMARSLVLDPDRDPEPDVPYTLAIPGFVLAWQDGRMLLVDAGMSGAGARAAARRSDWLPGAGAAELGRSLAAALGDAVSRVGGVVFTHLHVDHVEGIQELCRARGGAKLTAFLNPGQAEHSNYTTRGGLTLLREAGCIEVAVLRGDAPLAVPGFPGVSLVPVGGHTPGSQWVRAQVGADAELHNWIFTGDVVNHVAGIDADIPKPLFYRLLVTPEANQRLGMLRRALRSLRDDHGARLVVAHDLAQIDASGIPRYAD